MAKLIKVEMYISDYNDENFDIVDEFEGMYGGLFDYVGVKVAIEKEIEIDWNDDIDINRSGCTIQTYRKYFKEDNNE